MKSIFSRSFGTKPQDEGHNFDRNKIDSDFKKIKIEVTTGQMQYEIPNHLLKKLEQRES